jgi:hypothetical protein
MSELRHVTCRVAIAVAHAAGKLGVGRAPRDLELAARVIAEMWDPHYPTYDPAPDREAPEMKEELAGRFV